MHCKPPATVCARSQSKPSPAAPPRRAAPRPAACAACAPPRALEQAWPWRAAQGGSKQGTSGQRAVCKQGGGREHRAASGAAPGLGRAGERGEPMARPRSWPGGGGPDATTQSNAVRQPTCSMRSSTVLRATKRKMSTPRSCKCEPAQHAWQPLRGREVRQPGLAAGAVLLGTMAGGSTGGTHSPGPAGAPAPAPAGRPAGSSLWGSRQVGRAR